MRVNQTQRRLVSIKLSVVDPETTVDFAVSVSVVIEAKSFLFVKSLFLSFQTPLISYLINSTYHYKTKKVIEIEPWPPPHKYFPVFTLDSQIPSLPSPFMSVLTSQPICDIFKSDFK